MCSDFDLAMVSYSANPWLNTPFDSSVLDSLLAASMVHYHHQYSCQHASLVSEMIWNQAPHWIGNYAHPSAGGTQTTSVESDWHGSHSHPTVIALWGIYLTN